MKIFAHRGLSGYYPENTILAFKKALEFNIYGIELDVHKSKDGYLVVIHDESIDRTFNGTGMVKDFTLTELRQFNCIDPNFTNDVDCKIPTLEDVLNLLVNTNVFLNIELKTDIIHYDNIESDVIDIVKKYNIEDRVILSSFNHDSIKICKSLTAEIEVAILTESPVIDKYTCKNIIDYTTDLGLDAIHMSKDFISENIIIKAKYNNIPIRIYTVNSSYDMVQILNLNVDAIFTDFPDKLISML